MCSGLMDKQILTSDASSEGAGRHAIGFLCGSMIMSCVVLLFEDLQ